MAEGSRTRQGSLLLSYRASREREAGGGGEGGRTGSGSDFERSDELPDLVVETCRREDVEAEVRSIDGSLQQRSEGDGACSRSALRDESAVTFSSIEDSP